MTHVCAEKGLPTASRCRVVALGTPVPPRLVAVGCCKDLSKKIRDSFQPCPAGEAVTGWSERLCSFGEPPMLSNGPLAMSISSPPCPFIVSLSFPPHLVPVSRPSSSPRSVPCPLPAARPAPRPPARPGRWRSAPPSGTRRGCRCTRHGPSGWTSEWGRGAGTGKNPWIPLGRDARLWDYRFARPKVGCGKLMLGCAMGNVLVRGTVPVPVPIEGAGGGSAQ